MPSRTDPELRPIHPQPGSASDPADFVGRAATTRRARNRLLGGANLTLTDPRRMGKSYWLGYFCETTTDFTALVIDYEGVNTAAGFLTRTAQALGRHAGLPDKAKAFIKNLFQNVEVDAGPVKLKNWARSESVTQLLHDTVLAVDAAAVDRPVLVCMDEVPAAIRDISDNESPAAAREVLQTLRNLRREARRIRWIVSGSIGFHHVLRQCGATEGDINDLDNLPLGPLVDDEARELVQRLVLGIRKSASAGAITEWVRCTGGIPFLIHHVANRLDSLGDVDIEVEHVETAFTDFINDRDDSRAATHLLTRLERYYDSCLDAAHRLLDECATSPHHPRFGELAAITTLPRDQLLDLVNMLIDDHYLSEADGGYAWRYDVLRVVWVHRRRLDA